MSMFPHARAVAVSVMFNLSLAAKLMGALVVTPEPGNLDGNSLFRPFNNPQPGRFQQVYDSSLFSSLPEGGGLIYYVFFRVDPFLGQSFSAGVTNLQINLSTTSREPDGLSPVFSENTGANDTIALGPGFVGIYGSGGGGISGFDVSFTLAQPFHYDPAMGNLLIDFRIRAGAGTSPGRIATLDAFDVVGDGVSSVFAYGDSLPTIGQVSSLGLATAFVITPRPRLTVFLQSSNLVLRWFYQPSGFTLEQSPILGNGADWKPVGGTVVTNASYKEVRLPLDTNAIARFFRLVLPSSASAGLSVDPNANPKP
jgi:hypothetical protein